MKNPFRRTGVSAIDAILADIARTNFVLDGKIVAALEEHRRGTDAHLKAIRKHLDSGRAAPERRA
ncbi:MAG: hypothetical protein KGL46_14385 [Hyphomicrobiales bacterium]|nr:hypothetical protein [Hyphomicrobiales bacterium]